MSAGLTGLPGADSVRAAVLPRNLPAAIDALLQLPVDSLVLQGDAVAAMDLQMLRQWDDGATRAAGAAEYQLARGAAQAGDTTTSLQHLERAILAHPMQADAVLEDGAFVGIRAPVQELVGRVNLLARMQAETSMAAAAAVMDSARTSNAPYMPEARTFLDIAQANFQLGFYSGYVLADQASILARQIALGSDIAARLQPARIAETGDKRPMAPAKRALWQATRRLWQRLPLLVVLLGWLVAGIVAGVATLPFREGGIAELRQLLAPIWALGLLGVIVLGCIRAILRLGWHRAR